ncbi:hypothetical protein ACFYOV_32290 [Streptomyces sp. NPDC005931]|uniref:hypothetical protein n=1 Tax=Streptomyces sp. NPDC005931 TaxID=3364737 RepID=UPI0036797D2E
MDNELQILLSEEGSDVEQVAQRTFRLREELLELDVDDVRAVPAQQDAPPGARAVDVAAVGALMVTLGGAATGLGQVVAVIRDWWGRCHGTRPSLRLTLDDDVLEISEASEEQVSEAFDLFVRRHAEAGA